MKGSDLVVAAVLAAAGKGWGWLLPLPGRRVTRSDGPGVAAWAYRVVVLLPREFRA